MKMAQYLAKCYPESLKIDDDSLQLKGTSFAELTETANKIAENFRDNFDDHRSILANGKKMGWRNEKYGVYGRLRGVVTY